MAEALSDLEELILRCRKPAGKGYITEAIACYKAGAYRSAVIAAWISVVYDFVSKLRELEMTGDNRAKVMLERFEAARQNDDVKASLEFERLLVSRARDEFELFSPVEAKDFERLFEDRNRCAHPSMVSPEDPYQPPAELARTHIRNVVVHLLALPPVQGKAAVASILRDVESEYFPTDHSKAVEFLRAGPFVRARDVLVRNVTKALLKDLLQKGWSVPKRKRRFAALSAVIHLHREAAESVLQDSLPQLVSKLEDERLYRACFLLAAVPESRGQIGSAADIKIRQYIENVPEDGFARAFPSAVLIPDLRPIVLSRLSETDDETLATIIARDPSPDYLEQALRRFDESHSFDSATSRFENLILPLVRMVSGQQEIAILMTYRTNDQAWHARAMAGLLNDYLDQRGQDVLNNKSAWNEIFDFVESNARWIRGSDTLLENIRSTFSF
ncbi:hypothetical protein [Alloacidobacterium sp.]|uniref:hypothetical protein n=1 Tax=Alloacidobacterium sp. TaxID=2951999 RepID=UPI002D3893AC|nr:hypothetical protein [Alloacidobacterium sp.]HYK37036.1 hypothetical protein [Alloacidobacterium sp.]